MKEEKFHVQLRDLQKSYNGTKVLDELSLNIRKGEFVAIVGKSGCGKSTLLRLLSGLEKPSDGQILIEQEQLMSINRQSCMMFQDGRLLPWKRVLDNVALGLKGSHRDEAMTVLKHVGLEHRIHEWPAKLSGGQKQRVALARALIHKPSLLLLDEPLGALDAFTRLEMQSLIENIWQEHGFTALLVTHDVEEAVSLADRVILLQDGMIAQDVAIPLPRPRQRDHTTFTSTVNQILKQILHEPNPSEPNRSEEISYQLRSVPKAVL
ncbi:ATP-binding cassette domain-containing protein [Sporosarcina luteola]|uniref:ATP-binding cassette domain-containing protein n=1 Tax=Sporosarcina luteola TaxID=582850 RepID=UPI00203DFD66|nr:ATP-binding cassette domain-containing protein [Sporosarcina luteola]MCM3709635.1 ATP-binding cassette domain-containing protein [Sporosarcina luteola]